MRLDSRDLLVILCIEHQRQLSLKVDKFRHHTSHLVSPGRELLLSSFLVLGLSFFELRQGLANSGVRDIISLGMPLHVLIELNKFLLDILN